MKRISINVRNRIIGGILLLIPFVVTVFIIRLLFVYVYNVLKPVIVKVVQYIIHTQLVEGVPALIVTIFVFCITLLIFCLVLYFVGTIGQIVAGRRLLAIGEALLVKIPLVGTIYSAIKQVINAVSLPERNAFKSVVLVQFPRSGMYALGFFTGFIRFPDGSILCKVFIPTTPNPTTGFYEMIPAMEVKQANISIEDAFKMIISGGLVSPEMISTSAIELPA